MSRFDERLDAIKNLKLNQFLGIENIEIDQQGHASFNVTVSENNANPNDKLHGGSMYALADTCCYFSLMSTLADNEEAVTHDIHVSVLSPANMGDTVRFEAELVRRGRRVAFMNARGYIGDKLILQATLTKSIIEIA